MTVNLSSFAGAGWQFFDNNGVPLVAGKIYSYLAGTTTPANTYTSSSGATPHSNPIILDAAGRVPGGEIWVTSGIRYKFTLFTSTNILIATYDNILGSSGGLFTPQNFTGTSAQTVFTLASTPDSENYTMVYINGVYQNKDTYSVSGNSLIFSEAPPLTSKIEVLIS